MKAMVLCAGLGTRMGDLTRAIPKPMLRVQARPILEYILANLRQHGFDDIAVNLHFRPEMIQDFFGNGSKWNLSITYSTEELLLGTAGGVKKMEAFFRGTDAFLVHYGDILTNQNLRALLEFHRKKQALATMLLHERIGSNSIVCLDEEQRVTTFLERPGEDVKSQFRSHWVNSGICVCSPDVLDLIPAGVTCDFPRDVFSRIVSGGRLFDFPLTGYRCAIDSPERLAKANRDLECGVSGLPHFHSPIA